MATTRLWHTSTLAEELKVADATEDDLYQAMDWLLARQARVEKKLAARHPRDGALVEGGNLQLSLFDEQNLAEIRSPEYPGERLVACFNPLLAEERRRKRQELIEATEKDLAKIAAEVKRRARTPLGEAEIALKAGRVLNRCKVGKRFSLAIADGGFGWSRREESIRREAELDGVYVARTSEPKSRCSAQDTVRRYKSLARVERAFRSLKGINLRIRPIHHRTEDHARARIFLCMPAYYVEWRMRRALAPLLFDDEQLRQDRTRRDPVAPAESSASAQAKKISRLTANGLPVQSFHALLRNLATRCRNTCRMPSDPSGASFRQLTEATPLQARALQLLGL